MQKYFPGYDFVSEVPQIVSIEKVTSASIAQEITPTRFAPPLDTNPVKQIQQDLLKSSYSNTATMNGSQSARVLPGINHEFESHNANHEKLMQLPGGKLITEAGYKLHQINQGYTLP